MVNGEWLIGNGECGSAQAPITPGPEEPGSLAEAPVGLKRALQRSFAAEPGDLSPGGSGVHHKARSYQCGASFTIHH